MKITSRDLSFSKNSRARLDLVFVCALVVSFGTSLALPNASRAESVKTLKVDGVATIKDGDVAEARDAAIRNAQKGAIESIVGVHIKAMMKDESYSAVKDQSETFRQQVQQKIESKTEGYIRKFKVVKEKKEDTTYRVTIRVTVADTSLKREISILGRKMAGARFPKIMFIVKEEYTSRDKKTESVAEPTLQAIFEDALLARGFDLVAQEQVEKLRSEEKAVFEEALSDDNAAAKMAMKYGAEYIVTGVARVRYTSFNDLGNSEHHAQAELALKGINVSSAALVASKKTTGNSPPNCYDENTLRVKTIDFVAPPLVDNLISRITQSWDRETKNGIRYAVKLYNVKSYKKQGRKFISMLKKLPGAKQVKKLSFGGGRLEVEVFYDPKHDVSQLEEMILDGSESYKALDSLDVKFTRGRELNFQL